jgi:LAO/AO transport system kinase
MTNLSLTPDVRCSQGLKKGIVELCDMVIVNKADGKLADAARSAAMDYTSAIKFLQSPSPLWKPKVCMITGNKKLMSTICN